MRHIVLCVERNAPAQERGFRNLGQRHRLGMPFDSDLREVCSAKAPGFALRAFWPPELASRSPCVLGGPMKVALAAVTPRPIKDGETFVLRIPAAVRIRAGVTSNAVVEEPASPWTGAMS